MRSRRSLALALALCLPWAQALALAPDEGLKLSEVLDWDFKRYATMGAAVALIEGGQVTYTYCYGWRRDGAERMTPQSLFQVGSISKMVAAIGLMQLTEQGLCGLDDPLGDLLGYPVTNPYHPDDPVTLRQLMTHTAGFKDSAYYDQALEGDGLPLSQLLTEPESRSVFYRSGKPGAKSRYANFGGGLIGILIEKLSGQTLDAYMAEHVFEPLQITAAYQAALLPQDLPLCDLYAMPERRLTKALRQDTALRTAPDLERDYTLTAGKLIISAPDLAKLLIALCDGGVYQNVRVLGESAAQEMQTVQNARGSVSGDSQRGLFMNRVTNHLVKGRVLYGHGGKAYGMLCAAYFDPATRTGAVMLTNGCSNALKHYSVGLLEHVIFTDIFQALESAAGEAEGS